MAERNCKIREEFREKCDSLRACAAVLSTVCADDKNRVLCRIAEELERQTDALLEANHADIEAFAAAGGDGAMLDRLTLTPERIRGIADGIRNIAALPDPVGEVVESFVGADGIRIERVRVPLGVIGIIYEARPNVTADCAALCLKTGNAVLLRGSSSAVNSNRAMVSAIKSALEGTCIPPESVELLGDTSREASAEMMSARGMIDVLIPRGGESLIKAVANNARVPVLETGVGNCHVYVHSSADPDMAERIVINSKTDRPSVCNAAETLLIDRMYPYAERLLSALSSAGVTIHGCSETVKICPFAVSAKFPEDYEREHLSMDMAVRFVDGVDGAANHISRFGTGHTEAIIAEDKDAAERFMNIVDAAVVDHNVSTRYTDGGMFGFGAEIGISTQKLHARGPMGLRELTSYKYKVRGNGQIRLKDSGAVEKSGGGVTLAVIGSGFMARAMVGGLIESGTLRAGDITVVNTADPESRMKFANELGCIDGNPEDISSKTVVLFAVKPQNFNDAAAEYGKFIGEDTVVFSIMAGMSTETVSNALGGRRVVRFMPNLALSKRLSATAYAPGAAAVENDCALAEMLFSPLGIVVRTEESRMSDVTALSGSGPAYFCRLAEAMIAAAVERGFNPEDARRLAVQTMVGTAKLLEDGALTPSELRERVTSKGGTTFAALCAMDDSGFDCSVKSAYEAARQRSDELGI